jgi:hypothetical protein
MGFRQHPAGEAELVRTSERRGLQCRRRHLTSKWAWAYLWVVLPVFAIGFVVGLTG